VVVTEHSSPREGRFVEVIGHYNPRTQPETLVLDGERLAYWQNKGAQASDTVRTLIDRMPPAPAAAPATDAAADAIASTSAQ
jgi:small subunit ribosomal protein S16